MYMSVATRMELIVTANYERESPTNSMAIGTGNIKNRHEKSQCNSDRISTIQLTAAQMDKLDFSRISRTIAPSCDEDTIKPLSTVTLNSSVHFLFRHAS